MKLYVHAAWRGLTLGVVRYSRTSVGVKDGSTPFTYCLFDLENAEFYCKLASHGTGGAHKKRVHIVYEEIFVYGRSCYGNVGSVGSK